MAVLKENKDTIEIQTDCGGAELYFLDGVVGVSEYSHDLGEFSEEDTLAMYNKMKAYYEQ